MNLCEIQKTIESVINDINSIKDNTSGSGNGTSGNNTSCECPYQVVIKAILGDSDDTSYEVIKGDFNTSKSKLQAGEYIDVIVYKMTIESGGEIIQYSYKPSSFGLIPAGAAGDNSPELIWIEWGNNMAAYWTESDIFAFDDEK